MAEFTMPSLGADMQTGILVEWLKKPGDAVKRGDIVAEVETDKGIIEVEVFTSGTIEKMLVQPGTKVPVGTPLAVIAEAGEPRTPAAETTPSAPAPHGETRKAEAAPISRPAAASAGAAGRGPARASPAARRRARELGVALESLAGTGPAGAITLEDIERAARAEGEAPKQPTTPTPGAQAGEATADAQRRMRQAIAAAMARSKREIPHYYASTTTDVQGLLDWLAVHNKDVPPPQRLIPAVMFVKAVALALRHFPELNSRWDNDRVIENDGIHVGPAISLRGGGLVAPGLRDTDKTPVLELMTKFRDLVTRARSGALRSSEFSGGTITVTNLGDRGTEAVYGVIYPPQVAIVGFGRVVERPWVVGGAVIPRHVVSITLSADHRVSDGHRGALFLEAVANLLQKPEEL